MLNPRAPVYRIELEVRGTLGPQPTGRPLFPPGGLAVAVRGSLSGTPRPRAPEPQARQHWQPPPCGRPLVLVNTRPLSRRASRPSLTGARTSLRRAGACQPGFQRAVAACPFRPASASGLSGASACT
jgi:hypothetical protein